MSGVKKLVLGTMKSSKSALLIMNGYNLDSQRKKVLTFKPETDTRDGEYVVSRALTDKRLARMVSAEDDGSYMYDTIKMYKPDVVLLDEIQFFTDEQIQKLAYASIDFGTDIYAYGLMISYNGEMFNSVKKAIECGFEITFLEMGCDKCNKSATHHLLYLDGVPQFKGDTVKVEDFGNYKQVYNSVCYDCFVVEYKKFKNKKE